MSQDSHNPFAFPGLNTAFMSSPNNPLLTSMDMMRQAMGSMGYAGQTTSSQGMANPMAPEELEKRIADLKVVENWLKLNLSMLSSTIQGMEVQLATVKTLQSFVAMGQSGAAPSDTAPSPLEIALGLKPAPDSKATARKAEPEPPQSQPPSEPACANAGDDASSAQSPQQAAAQGWWNMLENQFAQIAAATANAAKANQANLQKAAASAQTSATTPKKTTKRTAPKKTTRQTRTAKKSTP
jgi:hypothetical protein